MAVDARMVVAAIDSFAMATAGEEGVVDKSPLASATRRAAVPWPA
jgi:hypothetical protein